MAWHRTLSRVKRHPYDDGYVEWLRRLGQHGEFKLAQVRLDLAAARADAKIAASSSAASDMMLRVTSGASPSLGMGTNSKSPHPNRVSQRLPNRCDARCLGEMTQRPRDQTPEDAAAVLRAGVTPEALTDAIAV